MRSRKQAPGVLRTFTLLAAEEDIARTLAQPDAVFCDSEELAAGPARTPVGDTGDACTSARGAVRPHLGKGGAQRGGGALSGRDLREGRGNVANGEFRVVHVRSDLQHADFLSKPLQRGAFCVHRNFVMNIP